MKLNDDGRPDELEVSEEAAPEGPVGRAESTTADGLSSEDEAEAVAEGEITPAIIHVGESGARGERGGDDERPSVQLGEDAKPVRIPELLPILPIRDTVAFPGTLVPLTIGREKSKQLIDDVISGSKLLGIVAQRHARTEDPELDDLYRVGTVAAVLKLLKLPDGTRSIVAHGLMRFGIEELVQTSPYIVARAHPRLDIASPSTELEALVHRAREQATQLIEMSPNVPAEALVILNNIEEPGGLADFLAANLNLELTPKQELLETFDVIERLRKVNSALARQLEVLDLSKKIETQVKQQIDKSQREYYLQEQMRAIQKELGETDGRQVELTELRQRVADAKMPELVLKEADRELERMERIPQASPEYGVSREFLEWLIEMPWSVSTEDNLDLARAERVLNEDHYGLEKVKKRILEYLAVRKLNPTGKGPILCFAGPPGVGKTSLGQSIARALERKFIRVSLGGVRDEADIRGHRRTYIGAMPGRIIQEIRKAGSNNPLFMLDEVDKLGADFRGDPSSALLEVLDPQQNFSFQDHYLSVPFDLSKVMFIATANYMDAIPPPLRDRMEVIELHGYTLFEKLSIAKRYLVKRQMAENGLTPEQLRFDDAALTTIVEGYTHEAGVRNLEREIGSICRGVAAVIVRGGKLGHVIRKAELSRYLGPVKFEPELAQRTSVPGVVTGLAWTPVGGDILFVEATAMPGKGNLMLTGQIGDVMKESVQAAFSLVRSRAKSLEIDAEKLSSSDVHVHVPAGAIPKDGPSAGVAMITALVSLLRGVPCRPDVAMTGEITLRGLVLPIGGLKEKTLAAHRAGIKTIIFPARNEKDLEEVPKEIRDQIKFVAVKKVDEVLATALKPRERSARVPRAAARTGRSATAGTAARPRAARGGRKVVRTARAGRR
ncbi:MAG: endopeptidase La [Phycisphaerae bacterium]|nr:endopeptidase La [Phycisphaerae bacterium]